MVRDRRCVLLLRLTGRCSVTSEKEKEHTETHIHLPIGISHTYTKRRTHTHIQRGTFSQENTPQRTHKECQMRQRELCELNSDLSRSIDQRRKARGENATDRLAGDLANYECFALSFSLSLSLSLFRENVVKKQ